ncbi:major capsid protein [Polycyclovorans algicola]|uniref:major capsid protein n=1 Tax=Polycyclovorans algicola TaxID=616992 RepID=UPI0004A7493E|nr:major capsid protein [Polycyclovorans algicola]
MFQAFKNLLARISAKASHVSALVASSVVASPVLAQTEPTIDTAGVTSFITGEIVTGIAAVGAVFLIVAATFAGFRWVRGAAGGN